MSWKECSNCELCNFANHTCIQGIGKKSKVFIVGDNPNFTEDREGEYGHGRSYDMLKQLCQLGGIKEYYYTPVVKCRKSDKGKVSATQLKACKEYLFEELEKHKPDFVITLGATALKALTNRAKITEIHGQVIEDKRGFTILPTFHPAMSLRDPRFWNQIHVDFKKFGKVIRGEGLKKHKLNWKRIQTKKGLEEVLKGVMRSRAIAFDLETNGLQMRYPDSGVGITVIANFRMNWVIEHEFFSKGQLVTFFRKLKRALKGKVVVGQNAKFDNLWLYYRYETMFYLTFDTMLASHLLDENSPNGLKENAMFFLESDGYDIPLWLKQGKFKGTEEQIAEQKYQRAKYAAWDGYYTIRLYKIYKSMLAEEPELERLFEILVMPVARAYEIIETNGVHIDQENMAKAKDILKKKLSKLIRKLNRIARDRTVNWASTAQVVEVLFDKMKLTPAAFTDGGDPSTAEDNLKKMSDQHEIIDVLLEFRGVHKQLTGFIDGWGKRMIDGKLYPGFKISGTVTGRPSCSNPNLQQVPRDPFIRSLIGAPPGWTFFEADYSQLELRIAAILSGEPNMVQVFRTGGDIHESTYQMIMGESTEDAVAHIKNDQDRKAQLKEERKKAKAINFGFIYGMGWKKFMEYAETKMDLKISERQAKDWRNRYFEVYSGLPDWHERQRRIVRSLGRVHTLSGRIRHLPQIDSPDRGLSAEAERQSINSPVQGFGAELILMSVVEIQEYFNNKLLKMQGTIHDAIVGIVREDVAMECMSRVKVIMEDPRIVRELGIELTLPITADISLGNWGIAKEYDASELPEPINV